MAIVAPYPDLSELLTLIGEAGRRMSEIDATEGGAGNISAYIGWEMEPRRVFPNAEPFELPEPVGAVHPSLTVRVRDEPPLRAGDSFLITGSGRRLREIIQDPAANLGFLRVGDDGTSATLFTSPRRLFAHLTTEFNSHLAVHLDQVRQTGTNFHAVIHAQPPYLTYLSHIPRYQDESYLNTHLLRWQPEMIVNLPEGVGYVPFLIPGSPELMAATVAALRTHRVALWGKHGVMARSDLSVKRASDRIEYAEAGARYETMNLANDEMGQGLSPAEVRAICAAFGVKQSVY